MGLYDKLGTADWERPPMQLEAMKNEALELLSEYEGSVSLEPHSRQVWLGVGYCVAKGWASYSGGGRYQISDKGKRAWRDMLAEANK